MPSLFDWIAAVKHRPFGNTVPWVESRSGQDLVSLPGSIVALHVPSAGASGSGALVFDRNGDAAFITQSGICWEIPGLASRASNIHRSADGSLSFFIEIPVGLHVTVHAEAAHIADEYLLGTAPTHSLREGKDMGIFGKKMDSSSPRISYPAGYEPPHGVSPGPWLAEQALSSNPKNGLSREDLHSYADAAYAQVLGIPETDPIIAWGDATITSPQDSRTHNGTVAVTRNTTLAYWQPGRTSLIHTFQGNHSAVADLEIRSDQAIAAVWSVGEYANNDGKFLVSNAPLVLQPKFGKDGHANRRALTWFWCLAHLLRTDDEPERKPDRPPSWDGDLGSGGTKL